MKKAKKQLADSLEKFISDNDVEILKRLLIDRKPAETERLGLFFDGWIKLSSDGDKEWRVLDLRQLVDDINHWSRSDVDDPESVRDRMRLSKLLRKLADDLDLPDDKLPKDFWA